VVDQIHAVIQDHAHDHRRIRDVKEVAVAIVKEHHPAILRNADHAPTAVTVMAMMIITNDRKDQKDPVVRNHAAVAVPEVCLEVVRVAVVEIVIDVVDLEAIANQKAVRFHLEAEVEAEDAQSIPDQTHDPSPDRNRSPKQNQDQDQNRIKMIEKGIFHLKEL
jgi:hypothetical protein